MPYGVAVVIGDAFSNLTSLACKMHVWVPEIDAYAGTVQEIRSKQPTYSNECGVTTYHFEPEETPEETLLSLLISVDMHHGSFSHDPPWQFMEVHGASLTDSIKEAFQEYDATRFDSLPDGFRVSR